MDTKDLIVFGIGVFAGYYFVSHFRKTGRAY